MPERSISVDEFDIISKIGREIISTLNISEVIERIYSHVNTLINANIIAVGIFNDESVSLDFWGAKSENEQAVVGRDLVLDNKYWAAYCFNEQKEILINDYSPQTYDKVFSYKLFAKTDLIRRSFIYIPLTINQKRYGILTVQSFCANAYNEKHFQIVKTLASYITLAIQNALNYQKIKIQNREILRKSRRLVFARKTLSQTVKQRTNIIEQQKQKLEIINKELERLSIVARQTQNAIMIMDAQGYVLWFNDFFTELYEYTYEQFTAMRGQNIRKTSFNPNIESILSECINNKKAVIYEALNVTVSGREIWSQTTLTPIIDANGDIVNLVTIDTDITKRKLAENEIILQKERIEIQARNLEEANEKLEKLSIVARQTENAIMIMDALGNIQWINEYFTRIYEYTFDEFKQLRGKNIVETSFNPDIRFFLNECISKKEAVRYDALNISVTGQKIWTQTTLTPVLDSDGNIKHLVTIDTDISKLKDAEEKIIDQNKNITDSIKYASRIQNAVMPSADYLKTLFNDYFIFYKPRNIVSGDFYWVKEVKSDERSLLIIAVADCTGHGVPGAFLSMLGISFLADIVSTCSKETQCISTNVILEELRRRFKKTLQQNTTDGSTKDGMDVALCIVDRSAKTIQYSGANNPVYLIRKNDSTDLEILHPTKNPIGIFCKEDAFKMLRISYNPGDLLYLFTDGIIDQFGGESGRKFMARKLQSLLCSVSHYPMDEQCAKIENALVQWQGTIDQVDDILVFGVRL